MKISLEWLAEYLPGTVDAQKAADVLTMGGFPVEGIETIGQDTVLDVEVTSNRGDCLSHLGVARELGALMDRPWKTVEVNLPVGGSGKAGDACKVSIAAVDLCPHYTARVIKNVKIGPSPAWMVRRLEAVGLRPICNVVDATNYVMFELGQPLHAFDLGKLADQQIIVRQARAGEKITSIDGHERVLTAGMLVIADSNKPVALAGVMGGLDSEVSGQTADVLIESARFDALSVRTTARALQMRSDSSYRFERGIPVALTDLASKRCCELIVQMAGGQLLEGVVSVGSGRHEPRQMTLRLARMDAMLGVGLDRQKVIGALERLGFAPQLQGEVIAVTVPWWRLDISIEVDLIEEAARVVGYDQIPTRDEISIRVTPPAPERKTLDVIHQGMVSAGYFESLTFSWVSDALAGDFLPAEAAGLPRAQHTVRKADGQLRPSILPGLLESVRRNETVGNGQVKLYEAGSTFWTDAAGKVIETQQLAMVGDADLRSVRGTVEAVLSALDGRRSVDVVPADRRGFAAGASGKIVWGDEVVGYLGRIDPAVASKLGLRQVPAGAELLVGPLLAGARQVPQLRQLPKFPAIRRDLSLIVAEKIAYAELAEVVRQTQPADLEELEYVTTYRGKPLEKGTKSVTITLVFRRANETLTSEEVEPAVQRVVTAAAEKLGATQRS